MIAVCIVACHIYIKIGNMASNIYNFFFFLLFLVNQYWLEYHLNLMSIISCTLFNLEFSHNFILLCYVKFWLILCVALLLSLPYVFEIFLISVLSRMCPCYIHVFYSFLWSETFVCRKLSLNHMSCANLLTRK